MAIEHRFLTDPRDTACGGDYDLLVKTVLEDRGYRLIRKIGEGNTRDVYEVEYKSGRLKKRRVAKIPKQEVNTDSPTTLINMSKGDMDEREVLALNQVKHPNIVEIYDAFKFGDRTITIEEHFEATSLEDLVERGGPITNPEKLRGIFKQVLDALQHLHNEENLLHRDIKPSNILVGKNGAVKITDLQNAGKRRGDYSMLPTRGGTPYTAPKILNALMSGEKTRCDVETEFYALGATLFYALTGEQLSDISLVHWGAGNVLDIAGRNCPVALKDGEEHIQAIDITEHDRRIKKQLQKVDKNFRNLLRHCLISSPRVFGDNYSHSLFNRMLDDATAEKTRWGEIWKSVKKHSLAYVSIAGLVTGFFGGLSIMCSQISTPEPTLFDVLISPVYGNSAYAGLFEQRNAVVCEELNPYFNKVREMELDKKTLDIILDISSFADRTHRLGNRSVVALHTAIALQDSESAERFYGSKRIDLTYVPKQFVDKINRARTDNGYSVPIVMDDHGKYVMSVFYLKTLLPSSDSPDEVFVRYFCSEEDIFEAQKKAGTMNYYPTMDATGELTPGFGSFLDPVQRDLINTALAIYYITDPEGKVHTELIGADGAPLDHYYDDKGMLHWLSDNPINGEEAK